MVSRRYFIRSAFFSGVFYPSVFCFGENTGKVVMTCRCHFPERLSFDEYNSHAKKWRNSELMSTLVQSYKNTGAILLEQTHFQGVYMDWQMIFSSLSSYKSFFSQIGRSNVFDDEVRKRKNFFISWLAEVDGVPVVRQDERKGTLFVSKIAAL